MTLGGWGSKNTQKMFLAWRLSLTPSLSRCLQAQTFCSRGSQTLAAVDRALPPSLVEAFTSSVANNPGRLHLFAGLFSVNPDFCVTASRLPPPDVAWSLAREIGSHAAARPELRPAAHALLRAISLAPESSAAASWDAAARGCVRAFGLDLALALRPGMFAAPSGSERPASVKPGSPEALAAFLSPALLLGALAAPCVSPRTAPAADLHAAFAFPGLVHLRWPTAVSELWSAIQLLQSLPPADVDAALAASSALSLREVRASGLGPDSASEPHDLHVALSSSQAASGPVQCSAASIAGGAIHAGNPGPGKVMPPVAERLEDYAFPLQPVPREQALAEAEAAMALLQARAFERLTAPSLKRRLRDVLEGETAFQKAASLVKGILVAPLFLLGHWLGDRPRKP